ncbi:MAG: 5-oxoprolinase subunit PxpA [Rhodospirillales bacterium]|nr:5-oxoprolinase subunit PxpA [Rhodospirillales bacterium]
MARDVNLNADMGEGYGAFAVGDDAALLKIVRSASIACGFHAGDFMTMRDIVGRAVRGGVSIGAHPGFNDLWGFGRRRIDMSPSEVESLTAYQIGALQGIAANAGTKVTHVKPHGALSNMAAEREDYALAIGRAIKTIDRDMIYVAQAGTKMQTAAETLGLTVAREGFCDRTYEDDGALTSRKIAGSVLQDPEEVTRRVVDMVLNERIVARSGKSLSIRVDTICVHGDEPSAVAVARSVRAGLEAAGIRVVPLTEMALG